MAKNYSAIGQELKQSGDVKMQVALVTGASRGVGRGIAVSLNDAGFKVFATGRTVGSAQLPDAVVRVACDHLQVEETSAACARTQCKIAPKTKSAQRTFCGGRYTEFSVVSGSLMLDTEGNSHRLWLRLQAGKRLTLGSSFHFSE